MPCARLQSPGRTDPFRVIGYPSTPDRSYMLNEQFTWLTPFSQQASPELTWCDRRTRKRTFNRGGRRARRGALATAAGTAGRERNGKRLANANHLSTLSLCL